MCNLLITNQENQEKIEYANQIQKKRGPDYQGKKIIKNWTFLHNLLSITGEITHQPIIGYHQNSSEEVVVIFNGQIYNYLEFGNYKSDGYSILDLYLNKGIHSLKLLDGEFAIVIFDFKIHKAYCLRDTFGTKPLYYSIDNNTFNIASYPSTISRLMNTEMNTKKNTEMNSRILKVPPNSCLEFELKNNFVSRILFELYKWDLNQYKTTYLDWFNAFEESIIKRVNSDKSVLINLSSGLDSGGIVCALNKLNKEGKIDKQYNLCSILGQENLDILKQRYEISKPYIEYEGKIMTLKYQERDKYLDMIINNAENFRFKVWDKDHKMLSFEYDVFGDPACLGLAKIYDYVSNKYQPKIILSGSGSDEIMCDYAINGYGMSKQTGFDGKYPEDLNEIFPKNCLDYDKCKWKNFYYGTNEMYLMKEESINGSFGMEGRYPYLDRKLVQEFLWLSAELKNRSYKAPLQEYLKQNNYPYKAEKIGFNPYS